MKKLNLYIMTAALLSVGLSSCQKKYDPASFAPPINIGGYTSASEVAKANLVAYWGFNGNLVDSVSNTAAVNTGTTFSAGVKGQSFQGALDSYALATPSAAIIGLKSFTAMFWVNTPPPSVGVIGLFSLAKTDGFWGNIELFYENGSTNAAGKLRIHLFNGVDDRTLEVNTLVNMFDKWVHMAVSYDEATSTVTLYVNGARITSGKLDGLTGPLKIVNPGKITFGTVQFMTNPSQTSVHGAEPWASFLTGRLDEVRIYNKALTDIEVGAIVKLEGRGK
jgi:hypothetical protein